MTQSKGPQNQGELLAPALCRKAIVWWLPLLYLLISSAFYLRTYDSAQVKITLLQMGGLSLLALWLCRLVENGWRNSFLKEDMVCLAPFLAFLASGILSFMHAPYHWSSLDLFLRRIFYMSIALIVIKEFSADAVGRLVRFLIGSAWIAAGYGVLQWFDFHCFPPGVGQGIDPFLWRGAFGDRIFSTYGNPNFFADYLVIMFPILVCQFFKTRRLSLLVLIAFDLFNIYESQTKGAWIGLGISGVLLAGTYFIFIQWEKLVQNRLVILAAMIATIMLTMSGVAWKLGQSFTSINFRLFTWEATWEMIMTHPLTGTGVGSFWVIYPAFRRPPIFHIEGKHNTETDHVEDEYLEVLFDEGILGLGIFLWLILSTFVMAYRSLGQMTGSLKSGERAPPRAYDLAGFLVALQGMLAHNCFDVSLRFVSSGVYLGLLSGIVVNLSRGYALSDLRTARGSQETDSQVPIGTISPESPLGEPLLWLLRIAACLGIALFVFHLVDQFSKLQMPGEQLHYTGEYLQWAMAWACMLYCAGRLAYYCFRILWASRNVLVPGIMLATLPIFNCFWGFFQADVYQNMAIAYSRAQQWDLAVKSYQSVAELNPAYIMAFYFTGNVFTDRFNMTQVWNPDWGDTPGIARNDFERAKSAFEQVRLRSPNYVQTLNQLGNLYVRHGDWLIHQGHVQEGQQEWDKALDYFKLYHNIDPVFAPNYYAMARIFILRGQYDKAVDTYLSLIEAKECRVDPKFLRNDWIRGTLMAYQSYTTRDGQWVHLHEAPQTYTDLGGAYWMKGDPANAEKYFLRALEMDPNFDPAKQNLNKLHQQMRLPGAFRRPPPIAPGAPSGNPIAPSFELTPSRR